MKKGFLTIFVAVLSTSLFAQINEAGNSHGSTPPSLKEGVIIEKAESYSGTQVWNYSVKDIHTGDTYGVVPTSLDIPVGREVIFRLQTAINTQSQTNNMITNKQNVSHDARMASIQNAR